MPRHERLHQQQQQQQQQRSTGNILNRVRHSVRKLLSIHKHNSNHDNNDTNHHRRDQTSNEQKRDWRTLSPEFPPLPSVDPSPPNTTFSGDTIISNTNNSGAEHLTSLTDNKIDATNSSTTSSTTNSISTHITSTSSNTTSSSLPPFQFSHSYRRSPSIPIIATGVVEGRHLYTIPEEGETMDVSLRNSNEHYPPPSSVRVSDESSASSPSSSSVSSNSSSIMYRPPTAWFTEMPDAPHDDTLIGDEVRCQLKLARIVQAASKQQKHDQNARTEILFDDHDNVRSIRIITRHMDDNNKISDEFWRFSGNSQYLAPELPCGVYNQSLADVWIMGIILYRMLVGKYPFTAPNDRKLFSKMMHGDFSIPAQLSDDAKDLLRRMLAPGNARASLDLVLFHPWLKPCSSIMLANNEHTEQQPVSAPFSSVAVATSPHPPTTSKPVFSQNQNQKQPSSSVHSIPSPQQQQQDYHEASVKLSSNSTHSIKKQIKAKRKKRRQRITKSIMRIFIFLTKGPYPPPNQPYRELALLGRVHPTTTTVSCA